MIPAISMQSQTFTEKTCPNLQRISCESLNARQWKGYNFLKISGILADYGYLNIRLTDDRRSADFIAQHVDGTSLKVQLKGRLIIADKYQHQAIHICFRSGSQWYLYPHDLVMHRILATTNVANTESWAQGLYTFPALSKHLLALLAPYRLDADESH